MGRTKGVAKATWNALKAVGLNTADAIVTLSLLRQGTRPKPGIRTSWPKGWRDTLNKMQNGLCVYCRGRLASSGSHIDHVTPVNQGGSNELDNLQLLCPGCNLRKSDRTDPEFRYRYRSLLPQERGRMPGRRLKQTDFRKVTQSASDLESYARFKAGKYLTANQKVNSGAIATFVAVALAIFLPIQQVTQPDDGSVLLVTSLLIGGAAGAGVRLRARHTGKDQED